jgi:hypothetical protein
VWASGGHQARDRAAVLGDLYLATGGDFIEQRQDLCLGFRSGQLSGHIAIILV